MSIQTQIDRILGNVSATFSAITDKGVDVPEGSTSDSLAALIADIAAGGSPIMYGSIKLAKAQAFLNVTHGLGVVPNFVMWFAYNYPDLVNTGRVFGLVINGDTHYTGRVLSQTVNHYTKTFNITDITTTSSDFTVAADSATDSTIVLGHSACVSTATFRNSCTYHYIVGVL